MLQRLAWGNLFKVVAVAAILVVVAYFMAKADVLRADSYSDRLSGNLLQAITSPFQDNQAQQLVTVAYLDEAGLDWLDKNRNWKRWPPTYANNAEMLRDIYYAGEPPPRAIFLDFQYLLKGTDPAGFTAFENQVAQITKAKVWGTGRQSICASDSLIKLACIVVAKGAPVIIAGAPRSLGDIAYDGQEALDAVAVVASVEIRTDGGYPLDETPAPLMLAAYCMNGPDGGLAACQPFRRLKDATAKALAGDSNALKSLSGLADEARARYPRILRLQWSAMPHAGQNALNAAIGSKLPPCQYDLTRTPEPLRLLARLGVAFDQAARVATAGGPDVDEGPPSKIACPHALSTPYPAVTGALLPDDLRRQAFNDKLVLVGGYFHASNDWLATPLHGQTPGVQGHATALDNLLEAALLDREHYASLTDEASDQAEGLEAGLLFVLMVISGVRRLHLNGLTHERMVGRDEARLRLRLFALYGVGELGLVAGFVLIGFRVYDGLPINWLGVTATALAWTIIRDHRRITDDLRLTAGRGPLRFVLVWGARIRRWPSLDSRLLFRDQPTPPPAPLPIEENAA